MQLRLSLLLLLLLFFLVLIVIVVIVADVIFVIVLLPVVVSVEVPCHDAGRGRCSRGCSSASSTCLGLAGSG
ncbi:MAG TPA: hypothetical protein VJP78_08410 [Thermoleophilia bacterium]|nr:hypothetical protein [Thermoleophilia bacterium]